MRGNRKYDIDLYRAWGTGKPSMFQHDRSRHPSINYRLRPAIDVHIASSHKLTLPSPEAIVRYDIMIDFNAFK